MDKLKALLILNGKRVNKDILLKYKNQSDFILAADGAADYCLKLNILPNLVIGDLDSISKNSLTTLEEMKVPLNRFPVKKDKTDSQLSLEYLIDMGATEITIIGATGNRMDHTLANILLLKRIKDSGVKGKIVDENNTIYLVYDKLTLDKSNGYFVSIIPIVQEGIRISLRGFEYELDNEKIDFGSTRGISNVIKNSKGYIKVHDGVCLVFVSKD